MAAATRRTFPLLVTALVALAAVLAAAWLVFLAPDPKAVTDQPTLPVPEEPTPTPLLKPTAPARRPDLASLGKP